MRNTLTKVFTLLTIFMFILLPSTLAKDLVIFHTNDTHSRVSTEDENGNSIGLAEMTAAVKTVKAQNKATLWLDAGDTLHGMPRINISKGEGIISLLNASTLDAIAPGNHDYNYGATRLIQISRHLKAVVLSANTIYSSSCKTVFKPYHIFVKDGIKVGVFGLSTPETAYKANPKNTEGLTFLDPVEQARLMVKELLPKCDVIVAVMHMGLDESSEFTSRRIAEEAPGIDVIIDGHSHTLLPQGLWVGNTLIAQTGCHGANLGKVTVTIEDHVIVNKKAELLNAEAVAAINPTPDPTITSKLHKLEVKNQKLFSKVIAHTDRALSGDRLLVRRHEAELGNLTADAFRWKTGADIAVVNGGDMRTDLPGGDVTLGDIMAIFPFGSHVQVCEVTGLGLYQALEHSVFGYPASFGGFLHVSNLTFTFDPSQDAGSRVSEVYVGDEPLNFNKTYTIATTDFLFVGGDDYTMLKDLPVVGEYNTCEEIVAEYLNTIGMPSISVGRIHVIGASEASEAA